MDPPESDSCPSPSLLPRVSITQVTTSESNSPSSPPSAHPSLNKEEFTSESTSSSTNLLLTMMLDKEITIPVVAGDPFVPPAPPLSPEMSMFDAWVKVGPSGSNSSSPTLFSLEDSRQMVTSLSTVTIQADTRSLSSPLLLSSSSSSSSFSSSSSLPPAPSSSSCSPLPSAFSLSPPPPPPSIPPSYPEPVKHSHLRYRHPRPKVKFPARAHRAPPTTPNWLLLGLSVVALMGLSFGAGVWFAHFRRPPRVPVAAPSEWPFWWTYWWNDTVTWIPHFFI